MSKKHLEIVPTENDPLGNTAHPLAYQGLQWIHKNYTKENLEMLVTTIGASTQDEAELKSLRVITETITRILKGDVIGDRYILGAAWFLRNLRDMAMGIQLQEQIDAQAKEEGNKKDGNITEEPNPAT